jgi:hypothetical protein
MCQKSRPAVPAPAVACGKARAAVWDICDAILDACCDACCDAWNALIAKSVVISSIRTRD